MNIRAQLVPLISAVVCVVLQIVIAPMITIGNVVPNFIAAFVIILAIVRKPDTTYVYAFVLGLISDLLGSNPVGLSALLLLLASFVLSRAFEVLDKSTPAMPIIASAITLLLVQVITILVLLATGYSAGFVDLLVQRALPETVFDTVIVVVLFLISTKFSIVEDSSEAWSVPDSPRFR